MSQQSSSSRCSIVVSIPACHAGDPGSIPGNGELFEFSSKPLCARLKAWGKGIAFIKHLLFSRSLTYNKITSSPRFGPSIPIKKAINFSIVFSGFFSFDTSSDLHEPPFDRLNNDNEHSHHGTRRHRERELTLHTRRLSGPNLEP